MPKGDGVSVKRKLVMLSEFANLGYRVTNPELLDSASDALFLDYKAYADTLKDMRGGDVDYVPLFVGFPDKVPDDDQYFSERVLGYVGNAFHLFEDSDGTRLESGVVVPAWLFDLEQFGADPITQFQSKSLWDKAKDRISRRKSDAHTEWIDLELVWADDVPTRLGEWLKNCLYAKSSIKAELHDDIRSVLKFSGTDQLDLDQVELKENRALLSQISWASGNDDTLTALAKTPTDVLRLFAALTESDISLAAPIKFPRMNRRQRRLILGILERSDSLAEDLVRYKGLWREIGRFLHPGEYAKAYPKTANAFDNLRNGTIQTFDGRTEKLMGDADAGAVLHHLSARPGVLGRKVHELLRRFPESSAAILERFGAVAQSMTAKTLLVLRSYFATINDAEFRTVINKRGKIKVLPNNSQGAMSAAQRGALSKLLEQALLGKLAEKESWKDRNVWIDPELARYTVPLQQRAASDGLVTVGRGTRLPIQFDKVLRLFVYWKNGSRRTDLDLSVIQFDKKFHYAGHVSYTNLAASGIVHSGDLQSAPHGAAEFIDITMKKIKRGVRYVGVQVYRYHGNSFHEMDCHAGWMARSNVDANYKSFDIKTVTNKFDLNGNSAYCLPLIVDLKNAEVIMTDLYMGSKAFHNHVEREHENVAMASREIAKFVDTRPTMKELAELHLAARGGQAAERDEADVTIGVDGCTISATNLEAVLHELL